MKISLRIFLTGISLIISFHLLWSFNKPNNNLEYKVLGVLKDFIYNAERHLYIDEYNSDTLSNDSKKVEFSQNYLRFFIYVTSFSLKEQRIHFTFFESRDPNPLEGRSASVFTSKVKYICEISKRRVLIILSPRVDSSLFQTLSFLRPVNSKDLDYYREKDFSKSSLNDDRYLQIQFEYFLSKEKESINKYYNNKIPYESLELLPFLERE